MIEKLIGLLSDYFNIGDSYHYTLGRSKEAFGVGTMSLDDFTEYGEYDAADLAEFLMENGVTVQRWIPVTERLPDKDGTYIVCTTTGAVTTARFYVGKTYPPTRYRHTEYHRPTKWQSNRNVTHWMPLPEPPKEVE